VDNAGHDMAEKIAGISTAITLTASGSITIYGVVFQSVESLIGVCIALSTFIVMWYYSHKRVRILEKQADKE